MVSDPRAPHLLRYRPLRIPMYSELAYASHPKGLSCGHIYGTLQPLTERECKRLRWCRTP
jgi:hypothetical protein